MHVFACFLRFPPFRLDFHRFSPIFTDFSPIFAIVATCRPPLLPLVPFSPQFTVTTTVPAQRRPHRVWDKTRARGRAGSRPRSLTAKQQAEPSKKESNRCNGYLRNEMIRLPDSRRIFRLLRGGLRSRCFSLARAAQREIPVRKQLAYPSPTRFFLPIYNSFEVSDLPSPYDVHRAQPPGCRQHRGVTPPSPVHTSMSRAAPRIGMSLV